jgi:hypothetical protein
MKISKPHTALPKQDPAAYDMHTVHITVVLLPGYSPSCYFEVVWPLCLDRVFDSLYDGGYALHTSSLNLWFHDVESPGG